MFYKFRALKRKYAYPYEYRDSFRKFSENKLPDRKCFYRSLKDGTTGDNDVNLNGYISLKIIWRVKKFGMYLAWKIWVIIAIINRKKDVLLLADVFEKFIDTCLNFYGLDPCHDFSSAGLSWDAMLKMTGLNLEKISDIVFEKYLFIEKGLNGWISYIAKRYAKASNKCMKEYDSKKPSKFITYLDMNNLYDWAMSEYLPYEKFKWLKNVDGFDVNSVSEKSPIGYILELDLEYPDDLHVLHNDYPLAPEKIGIPYDRSSDFCKKFADKYEIKVGYVRKLIPNLGSKTKYVLVFRNETD